MPLFFNFLFGVIDRLIKVDNNTSKPQFSTIEFPSYSMAATAFTIEIFPSLETLRNRPKKLQISAWSPTDHKIHDFGSELIAPLLSTTYAQSICDIDLRVLYFHCVSAFFTIDDDIIFKWLHFPSAKDAKKSLYIKAYRFTMQQIFFAGIERLINAIKSVCFCPNHS